MGLECEECEGELIFVKKVHRDRNVEHMYECSECGQEYITNTTIELIKC